MPASHCPRSCALVPGYPALRRTGHRAVRLLRKVVGKIRYLGSPATLCTGVGAAGPYGPAGGGAARALPGKALAPSAIRYWRVPDWPSRALVDKMVRMT